MAAGRHSGMQGWGWGGVLLHCSAEGDTTMPYNTSPPPASHRLSLTAAAGSYLYPVSITCTCPSCIFPAIYLGPEFFQSNSVAKYPNSRGSDMSGVDFMRAARVAQLW